MKIWNFGFKKVIINRMSDAYKNVLRENQDLDFIWQGDAEEEIYTHTLHGHYGVDIAFYLDQRWYSSDKCPNPLDEKCVKRLIQESIHQSKQARSKEPDTRHVRKHFQIQSTKPISLSHTHKSGKASFQKVILK